MSIAEKVLQLKQDFDDVYAAGQAAGGSSNLPNNIAEINSGTWTQATTMGAGGMLDVEHGLTDTPDVIVIKSNVFDIKPNGHNLAHMFFEKITTSSGYTVYYNGAPTTRVNSNAPSQGITSVENNKFTIKTEGNRALSAGVTYSWLAMRWSK